MREIRFRGKCRNTGAWVYGSHVQTGVGLHYIIPQNLISNALFETVVDKESVGQYIGLKDKNGKGIYEGDIVDTTYDGSTFVGVVVYDLSELDFKATDGKEHYRQNFQYLPRCDEIEIIGNIYENPELLEVAE